MNDFLVIKSPDAIVQAVCSKLDSRSLVGVKKYGMTLDENNGIDTLEEALSEALDLALYLQKAIKIRDEQTDRPLSNEGL